MSVRLSSTTNRHTSSQHHNNNNNTFSTASLKSCCCCLFLLLIFLSLLAIAVTLVIILAVRPTKPDFALQRVELDDILVTPGGGNTASLSLNMTLVFTAENHNRVGVEYEASDLHVLYRGLTVGIAAVRGFEQRAGGERLVRASVSVSRFNVVQADAVELRVEGNVGAKMRVIGFNSPRVQVNVDCLIVISPRKQALIYKQCGEDGQNH